MVWAGTMSRLGRNLHAGLVRLLHWYDSGKPWLRIGLGNPCPLNALWAPFDLFRLLRRHNRRHNHYGKTLVGQ